MLLNNKLRRDKMDDPLKYLRQSSDIARSLIRFMRETPEIADENGHPVAPMLGAMILVRQRLFSVYGQRMAVQADELDELLKDENLVEEPDLDA